MKLSKKERKYLEKANKDLEKPITKYQSETHRVDKWSRGIVYKNKKAYSRKQKHKPQYWFGVLFLLFGFMVLTSR